MVGISSEKNIGQTRAWHGFLMGLAAFATYNVTDVFVKILSQTYSAFQVLFLSIFLSLPLIYAFVRIYAGPRCMETHVPRIQIMRGVLFFIYSAAGYYGIQNLPLANFYSFVFTVPLFTVIVAVLWLKEPVTKTQIGLLVISFIGVLVAFRPDPNAINITALVVLGGTFAGAVSQVMIRRYSSGEGLGASILIPEAVTAALALAACCYNGFIWPDSNGWLLFFICAVLSAIGNSLLVMAFYHAPASQVTPTHYSQMIWGTLLGYAVFGDLPDLWIVSGAVIIISAGIWLARIEYQQTHAAAAHE